MERRTTAVQERTTPEFGFPYVPEQYTRDLFTLRKEFQEFKAVVDERDRLKDRFNKERLAYCSIIVALAVALIMVLIFM